MIEQLTGILKKINPTHVIIDVHGVGYGFGVSLRTSSQLPKQGETISIDTYLHVKEGIMELYGFGSTQEKNVFLKLITVSGIGPRIALRILSEVTPQDMIEYIVQGQVKELTSLKGIGKKTAEVMIATLRSPLEKLSDSSMALTTETETEKVERDVLLALISLGVKEKPAKEAILKIQKRNPDASKLSTSDFITATLSIL